MPSIELWPDGAGVTEAWLRVKVSAPLSSTSWILERNGIVAIAMNPAVADTVVMDDSLAPASIQTYRAIRFEDLVRVDSTATLQVRTIDTTSHEFTWEIEYMGDGSSSALYDVAIVNDTLAYAVGEIYLRDSTGVIEPEAYNVTKWNGQSWELFRVQFPVCDINGNEIGTAAFPCNALWALSATSIWFTDGG